MQGNCSNPKSGGKSHEALAKIRARNDSGLNQIGSDREMVGFGYVFNIEPTGLAAKLDMGWERKRGVECNCKVFGLSRWKDGVDGTEILRWWPHRMSLGGFLPLQFFGRV